jgi:hypothetical protein
VAPTEADKAALYKDLLSIYARAGAEVTYETHRGEIKPYWAKRFLQAVKRANRNDELFEFVERLMLADEPSRGFLILKKAGRLDLSVEVPVCDDAKSYHRCFRRDAVRAARARLDEHGFGVRPARSITSTDGDELSGVVSAPAGAIALAPGMSFDVRVTVEANGALSFVVV